MEEYRTYLDSLWKQKVVIAFANGIALFATMVFLTRFFFDGVRHSSLYLTLIVAPLFSLGAYYTKRTGNYRSLAYLICLTGLFVLPIRAGATGGISSSVVTWFALVPLTATVIIGVRAGILITLLTITHFLLVIFFQPEIYQLTNDPGSALVNIVVILIGLALSLLLAIIYEKNRSELNQLLFSSYKKLEGNALIKVRNEQLETAQQMVKTYNHEINNPLQIALGNLDLYLRKGEERNLEKIQESLHRISEITKKIEALVDRGEIDFPDQLSSRPKAPSES